MLSKRRSEHGRDSHQLVNTDFGGRGSGNWWSLSRQLPRTEVEAADARLASVRAWVFLSALTLGEWGSAGRCSWCASVGVFCCRTRWPKPRADCRSFYASQWSLICLCRARLRTTVDLCLVCPNWVPTHGSQLKTREAFPEKKGGLGYFLKRKDFISFYLLACSCSVFHRSST